MSNINVLMKLKLNPKEIYDETSRLLIKIADNIIKDPSNLKIRTLQKNNATISKKILKVLGGIECLKLMGFQESEESLHLPMDSPLNKMMLIKEEIFKLKNIPIDNIAEPKAGTSKDITKNVMVDAAKQNNIPISTDIIRKVVLPPFPNTFTNPFFKQLEYRFHLALSYEDSSLQERALSVIPVKELERKAEEKLRNLQEQIKKGKLKDPELNLQDFLILELLSWFKHDFFEWVDTPDCTKCHGKTIFSHNSNDKELLIYTDRVEMHKCSVCNILIPFPRYQDLNILLETRKGRCGEWANTFTLLCRAMGWDARHVIDEADHVWTEVFSFSQKRWLHCDPCENVCDSPLIYESGWGKAISYITAYSAEEIQDVTWRYTSDHKAVMKRRQKCTENELVTALMKLRESRQKSLSKSRRDYLVKRLLFELAELMVERKPGDKDQQGRVSGSMAWRLSRGETQDETNSYTWIFNETDLAENKVDVQYSTSLDLYQQISKTVIKTINGWQNGVFTSKGIFRKDEQDWKMMYLCRNEGTTDGNISWKFIVDCDKVIDKLKVYFDKKIYENGVISIKICNDKECMLLNSGDANTEINTFTGSKMVEIVASLSGGKGDCAWQHAQLFRQSSESSDFPFIINFTFKKSS